MSLEEARTLPPGTFVAMGTSGLQPPELRAIAHVFSAASPPGAAAARFSSMVSDRVAGLADYASHDADDDEGTGHVPSAPIYIHIHTYIYTHMS